MVAELEACGDALWVSARSRKREEFLVTIDLTAVPRAWALLTLLYPNQLHHRHARLLGTRGEPLQLLLKHSAIGVRMQHKRLVSGSCSPMC